MTGKKHFVAIEMIIIMMMAAGKEYVGLVGGSDLFTHVIKLT